MYATIEKMLEDETYWKPWWNQPLRPKDIMPPFTLWARQNGLTIAPGGRSTLSADLHRSGAVIAVKVPGHNSASPCWIPKAIHGGDCGINAFLIAGAPWAGKWDKWARPIEIYHQHYLPLYGDNPLRYNTVRRFAQALRDTMSGWSSFEIHGGDRVDGVNLDAFVKTSIKKRTDEEVRYSPVYKPSRHLTYSDTDII